MSILAVRTLGTLGTLCTGLVGTGLVGTAAAQAATPGGRVRLAGQTAWVGAGEAIAHKNVTSQTLRSAVVRVRSNPSYRAAAMRVRDSIQAGGGAPRAAEMIEQSFGLGV